MATHPPVPAPLGEGDTGQGPDLLRRLALGDRAALQEVLAAHQVRITRLAHRLLGWRGDVEDVVQEVFLAAIKNARRFRGESALETWLVRITINKCRSWRRRWWRPSWWAGRGDLAAAAADEPAIASDTARRVRQAVADLPARDREVIVMHYLEQLSVEQLARMLDLSKNAAEVRLHRARRRLKVKLGDLALD